MPSKTPNLALHQSAGPSSNIDIVPSASHAPIPPLNRSLSRITTASTVEYKLYKRRFIGLAQLALLNIVISWDWITFAPVSDSAAQYFGTSETNINWASTGFLFAFIVSTPFTFWSLHHHGPRLAILFSAALTLAGNGVKYGGTASNNFAVMLVGQMIIGLAQPFALSSATSYSNLWFSPAGRTAATALISLANPFGAAIGQLISPFWVGRPEHISRLVGFVGIISAAASSFALFVPGQPPTPPSAASASSSNQRPLCPHDADCPSDRPGSAISMLTHLRALSRSPEFYLLAVPFSIYVGFFNAFSSLINQILSPYGFSEDDAGIAGAILIVVGLVVAAISSPIIDRSHAYLRYIRLAVPVIGICYLILVFAVPTRSLPFVYVVCGVLGAASFGLVPVALEFLVEIHYPLGPELGSSLCWCGGQLMGGIFIVVMDALKGRGGYKGVEGAMQRSLTFQAVLAILVMPLPLCLGLFGRQERIRRRRWEVDRQGMGGEIRVEDADDLRRTATEEEEQHVEGRVMI
ncbi:uncharacterized protein HMPREF1541_02533 [Cyphellophora europaea CBS 101466]|uniref:Major facilitator superfamily (MFS) profile domain-containing protein n=1 Tax=Cyphellophora europaea (strain CBS 101466) TaxID=1220924 RepID=W2S639_CYPE1|nr:uncharacterized protein HMPREF1541_02533 [Cyphellophora europaea CBS 101466]ETN43374.1 hypothetical protein HMPREF1541_02533 [Cyphellophora europaea CBS 101466]